MVYLGGSNFNVTRKFDDVERISPINLVLQSPPSANNVEDHHFLGYQGLNP